MKTMRELVIPAIQGDGIGPEIMAVTKAAVEAAVQSSYDGSQSIRWLDLQAGESAHDTVGGWLPKGTLDEIRSRGVALKGPLTTPVGGGIRSLNVAMRQALDLYSSVRPVRYFEGVPSPVKEPQKLDVVIFRENTEDVYKGIEWKSGSDEAVETIAFLRTRFSVEIRSDSGLGIKPMSEFASKRLVRAAVDYALRKGRRSVTLVHKGNIMKYTEGAFRDWGYELAQEEYRGAILTETELLASGGDLPPGKAVMNDRIADNMFQQILTRPDEYSVLATPNLNGDYLADACAAQVGGLGMAPGANIGDGIAVFEAVHGTAPKYAGKDLANPCSLMLSAAMMLDHLGLGEAGERLTRGIATALAEGVKTHDLARQSKDSEYVGTRRFGEEVILRLV